MLIELPVIATILLNAMGIPIVHLATSWWSLRLPLANFQPEKGLFRIRGWEGEGRFYERFFRVRAWKDSLPDAGPWFSGFSKSGLRERTRDYFIEFRAETCRGEFAHWVQLIVISLFVIWNPYPANLVIIGYALLSNLPCIISQRHTRARLTRVLASERP